MTRLRVPIRLRIALLATLGLALSGCGEVKALLEADHLVQRRLEYQPGVSEIYCYRTLAATDCYSEPQPGPPNRLVNAYEELEEE